jgi:acid phosphatase
MRTLARRTLLYILVIALISIPGVAQTSTPQLGPVVVVALENHSYGDVVGNSSMPYLNSLINQNGLAQGFYANVHGSFPDYAMVTAGQLVTTNGAGPPPGVVVDIDNIERQLIAAGKTWKVYAESLPHPGYIGGDQYPYLKFHNPFAYYSDNQNGSAQANNIVPFDQFAADVATGSLPNFSFVVPNAVSDARDCPGGGSCPDSLKLSTADQWLQNNIAPLLSSSQFQQGGLLVIWWDEGNASDTSNGGGHIPVILVGPTVKPGFRSTTFYRHENLLRTLCEGLGLGFPGAAASAASMAEFFGKTSSTGTITGRITSNATGAALSGASVSYSGGSTTTDGSGNYTLSNVPTGSVNVTASMTGFTSQTASVSVTSGTTSTRNFALAPSSTPTGTITGHVTNNSNGAALSGATVSYSAGSTTTDGSGSYTLTNVPAGNVSVTASLAGFSSQTASVTVASGVTVTLNFALTPSGTGSGTISGRVTNINTGGAISGATVSFSGGSTTTDSSGGYAFSNVAAGTYSLTATHTGYFRVTNSVTVSSGATATLNFALATGGKVAGTVSDASGGAISGAAVSITGGSIATTVNVTTSSGGTYNSNWVPIGTYTVTVSASGHTTQTKSVNITTGNTITLNFSLQ